MPRRVRYGGYLLPPRIKGQLLISRTTGGIIRNGREKKCDLLRDSPDFIPRCEKCAIPKGIWETYKVGAQEGAKSCGLEVIPQ